MSKRTGLFCFLLLSSITPTAQAANNELTIPVVTVKAPQPHTPSLSSGPKTVITREQITQTGMQSLSQALQNLGGVQLQDIAGNGSQMAVSMRGFGANAISNTLIMLNGIPLTSPDLAYPDIGNIPIDDITTIEVIAGSESVLYGDQAVGGIININTHRQSKENIELSCDAGSYNERSCFVSLNHHVRQLEYRIGVNAKRSNNYRDHDQSTQQLLSGWLLYPHANGSLQFDYKFNHDTLQFPGALTAAQVRQNRRQASNDTDFFNPHSNFLHLQIKQALNARWRLEADVAERGMQGNGVLFSPFTQSRRIYFIKPQLKAAFGNSLFIGGAELEDDTYRLNSLFGTTQDTANKYGVFSIANIAINQQLTLSVGGRLAEQQSRLVSIMPNDNLNRAAATTVGLTYLFTPMIEAYLRRAESYRFPKADENASTPPGVDGLKTQRGVAYETGLQWMNDRSSANVGLYQLALKDEITFDPLQTPQNPFGSNRNLDPTIRRGFSLAGRHQLAVPVTIDGQFNYASALFQSGPNTNNRIPLVSQSIIHAGLNYAITEHWSAYGEAVFTGNQYAANDDANIAGRIGGYTLINFNLRYQWKLFNAALHVNNVFNKYYYYYTVSQPPMGEFFYPAAGRNVTLSLNWAF